MGWGRGRSNNVHNLPIPATAVHTAVKSRDNSCDITGTSGHYIMTYVAAILFILMAGNVYFFNVLFDRISIYFLSNNVCYNEQ